MPTRPAHSRFPMHEPDGYPVANDMVIEATASSDGRLVPFCRVRPDTGTRPGRSPARALAAGAKGIKLHPRARAVHARSPGRPRAGADRQRSAAADPDPRRPRDPGARGAHTVALAGEFPNARFILAHARDHRPRLDLASRGRTCRTCCSTPPGSWAPTCGRCTRWVPPGQILFASDAPYGKHAAVRRDADPPRAPARPLPRSDPLDHVGAVAANRPPASRWSEPARPSVRASGAPARAARPRRAVPDDGADSLDPRPPMPGRRCSRSPSWPATSLTRSTTRPCSRRCARC